VPNYHYKIYKKFKADVAVCEKVWKQLLTLPLFPDLKDEQVEMIIDTIKAFKK
jgi:dTDP-4-amino-4,6-dideoxygalactose transaminase